MRSMGFGSQGQASSQEPWGPKGEPTRGGSCAAASKTGRTAPYTSARSAVLRSSSPTSSGPELRMCGEPAFSSNGHQRSQAILTAAQGGAVPVSSSSSWSQYGGDGGGGGGGGGVGGVGRLSQLVVVVMPRFVRD